MGVGYPGWHIECSGISAEYLGEYLDIHCGGVDNIFHITLMRLLKVKHISDTNGALIGFMGST